MAEVAYAMGPAVFGAPRSLLETKSEHEMKGNTASITEIYCILYGIKSIMKSKNIIKYLNGQLLYDSISHKNRSENLHWTEMVGPETHLHERYRSGLNLKDISFRPVLTKIMHYSLMKLIYNSDTFLTVYFLSQPGYWF